MTHGSDILVTSFLVDDIAVSFLVRKHLMMESGCGSSSFGEMFIVIFMKRSLSLVWMGNRSDWVIDYPVLLIYTQTVK